MKYLKHSSISIISALLLLMTPLSYAQASDEMLLDLSGVRGEQAFFADESLDSFGDWVNDGMIGRYESIRVNDQIEFYYQIGSPMDSYIGGMRDDERQQFIIERLQPTVNYLTFEQVQPVEIILDSTVEAATAARSIADSIDAVRPALQIRKKGSAITLRNKVEQTR